MAERHRILLSLPFRLRVADFLCSEKKLRTIGLLASNEFICDYKIPKYSSCQIFPVPVEEESKDYVAHAHYLQKITPREAKEGASQGNQCGWSPTVLRAEHNTLV
uniref:Uncharacterized protein n=1 Tax=Cannabis sativa TaxID=3483 RepID=A0A803Q696_CANSA